MEFLNIKFVAIGLGVILLCVLALHPISDFVGGILFFFIPGAFVMVNVGLFLISYGITPTNLSKAYIVLISILIYFIASWLLVVRPNPVNITPEIEKSIKGGWAPLVEQWLYGTERKPEVKIKTNSYYRIISIQTGTSSRGTYWKTIDGWKDLREDFFKNSFELLSHYTVPSYVYAYIAGK